MTDELDWPMICRKLSCVLPRESFWKKLNDFYSKSGLFTEKQISCIKSRYYEIIDECDDPDYFLRNIEDCGAEDSDCGFGFGAYEGLGL